MCVFELNPLMLGEEISLTWNSTAVVSLRRKGLLDLSVFEYIWLIEQFPQGSIHSVNVLKG